MFSLKLNTRHMPTLFAVEKTLLTIVLAWFSTSIAFTWLLVTLHRIELNHVVSTCFMWLGTFVFFGMLIHIRLKYPMRFKDSLKFYRANAKRRYPKDKWMRFWIIALRILSGA